MYIDRQMNIETDIFHLIDDKNILIEKVANYNFQQTYEYEKRIKSEPAGCELSAAEYSYHQSVEG